MKQWISPVLPAVAICVLTCTALCLCVIFYMGRLHHRQQQDIAEISRKLENLQQFGNALGIARHRNAEVQQSLQEPEITSRCRAIKEECQQDPVARWLRLELLRAQLSPGEGQEKLKEEIRQAEQEVTQLLSAHAGELSQLIQEKRLSEIATRTTPQLLKLVAEAMEILRCSSEISQSWNSIVALYHDIPSQDGQFFSQQQFISDQVQVDYYRKQYSRYVQQFEQWMYIREYDLAQQELENLWESLHSLENIPKDDDLVIAVRNNLKEVQSVKTLFSIAQEGARASIGEERVFYLKNGGERSGTILQYAVGYFTVETKENQTIQIALKKLRAEAVVAFALKKKENRYVYEYAGIFYLYEREFVAANKAFLKALEYGADSREIQVYLEKIPSKSSK